MFKGEAHDKPLTDSISEVKKLAKNIKKEADVCLHERIRSMDQNLSDVPNSVEKLLQLLYMFLRSNPKHTIQPTSGENMCTISRLSLTVNRATK